MIDLAWNDFKGFSNSWGISFLVFSAFDDLRQGEGEGEGEEGGGGGKGGGETVHTNEF